MSLEFISRLQNSVLFSTASQHLGFGPSHATKEGDSVFIFDGATTAHLLRLSCKVGDSLVPCAGKHSSTEKLYYHLVGEAFVHGNMRREIEELDLAEQEVILT